jgi:hypothetical protein
MALASTSRTQLRRIKESVFGTTPVAGNPKDLRFTGESFNIDVKKEESKEMRADRQIGYVVPVSASSMGGFNFHLNYASYDDEFESVLQGTWGVYGTNGEGTSFTADFAAGTITATVAPTGSSAFTTLKRGQWFRINAGAALNHGKFFKVSLTTSPTGTVITLDASTPGIAETGVTGTKVQTSRLANGVTQTSFTYEKEIPDATQFFKYTGMTPSKMMLKFTSAALIDGSFEFMGKYGARAAVTQLPGTPVASPTYEIQNGATGVGQLWEAGVPLSGTFIKTLDLTADNVLRLQEAIANFGAVGIGAGTLAVSGTLEAYFADGTLYDKFLANTYTSVTVGAQDPSGNGYIVTLPRVNLKSAKLVAGAKDQDFMASFEIVALSDDANADATLRKTIFMDRVGAAVT